MAITSMLMFFLWTSAFAQAAQAPLVSGTPKQSSGGFTLSPAPSNGRLAHGYAFQIAAGDQLREFAYIKNMSTSPVNFSLYGADPTVSNTGSPAYKTRDQSTQGEGMWVKFDQPEIELAGGEEKTVRFTVSVPPGTPVGDYRAGITMEKGKQPTNVPGISIATRMVSQARIKVIEATPADSTGMKLTIASAPATANIPAWKTYYFWISLGLFIISLGLLVWALFHEKKAKSAGLKSAAHHAGARAADAKPGHIAKSAVKHKSGKRAGK